MTKSRIMVAAFLLVAIAGCSLLVGIGDIPVPVDGGDAGDMDSTASDVVGSEGGSDATPSSCEGGGHCDAGALGVCQAATLACVSGQPMCTTGTAVGGTPCDGGECTDAGCQACSDGGATRNGWNATGFPASRSGASMAYQAGKPGRVILGPGYDAMDQSALVTDTWSWSPTSRTWSLLATGAPQLSAYALASDGTNLIVFGGAATGLPSQTTYCWSDATKAWLDACGGDAGAPCAMSPSARSGAVAAYDADDNLAVLVGGFDGMSSYPADTWVWRSNGATCDGTTTVGSWSQGSPSPVASNALAMTYDRLHGQFVVYGAEMTSTYLYDPIGDSWATIPSGPSPPRYLPLMAYDDALQRTVLFGGYTGNIMNACPNPGADVYNYVCFDQWEWDGACWTRVSLSGGTTPPQISATGATMAYDGLQLLVTGGWVYGYFNSSITETAVTHTWWAKP